MPAPSAKAGSLLTAGYLCLLVLLVSSGAAAAQVAVTAEVLNDRPRVADVGMERAAAGWVLWVEAVDGNGARDLVQAMAVPSTPGVPAVDVPPVQDDGARRRFAVTLDSGAAAEAPWLLTVVDADGAADYAYARPDAPLKLVALGDDAPRPFDRGYPVAAAAGLAAAAFLLLVGRRWGRRERDDA